MVKQIQDIEEYYESSDDDDPLSIFYAPTYYSTDEQLVIIACLLLLQQRYVLLQSMSPYDIVEEVEDIMDNLYTELSNTAYEKSFNHIRDYFDEVMSDYSIPLKYVSMDTSMLEIMDDSIDGLVNQLRDELRVKSKFFEDNLSKDSFNILPNFKRAVQRLTDAVGNNLIYGKEKSKRNVYKFVYGEDKLYRWLCVNDMRTCNWCLMQQSLPPRTIDELPLDHPHGRCSIDPIDYTYSDEYYLMLARGEYAPEIEAFSPTDERRW